ncbi:callose synthase 9-like [Dorcoceras hygrometricum]|uniref:Callose synthase 9-like n=1 Tax=Dorcoceras hygrometricum TaxID=472368 RepID=A0A2Z7BB37_9LAMI|nr:callose synthase 9-like [Dorcoceras hygrometricum]
MQMLLIEFHINISEDIYSGSNLTLRQESVTHQGYIQVGKGRDVGLNQIALFAGKVAGGNGEQVLSRDIYRVYLELSGVDKTILDRAQISQNTSLSAALNSQFRFQVGVFTAVPMILGSILEQGFRREVSFVTMQFQRCTAFFTFSLGTRTHYFGRTILQSGAKYQVTGGGFVVRHIRFTEIFCDRRGIGVHHAGLLPIVK